MEPITIEHMAKEPEGLTQACSRCGVLISDNRNVMIQSDDGDYSPVFWRVGELYNMGQWWSITPPTSVFRPCNPS